ncbi:MAG TPA: RNA polymerase sigma-54 factor, partial [Verrucomicrobia bacterium]|nr:RNA polymerase sigma-54 factor [Verrucomicrobiota bacterium]
MAFEPRMQLGQRLAQMQVMSPQMQQSLALLQAPMLDLRAMINKELQENPVLEELSPDEAAPAENGEATPEANGEIPEIQPPEGTQVDPTAEGNGEPVDDFSKELERLTEMSEEWRDHFTASQVTPIARPSEDDEERRQFMMESITSGTSLQDLLMEQSNQSDLDLEEMKVAEEIIGNIDDNGFLQVSVEELVEATG